MESVHVDIPAGEIQAFCRRWQITELSLFGSVLRDGFRPDSDIDVLVEFSADAPWSLLDWAEMLDQLRAIFGRPADLVEKAGLRNPFRRSAILQSRRVIYAA